MSQYYFLKADTTKPGVPKLLESALCEHFVEKDSYIKDYAFPPITGATPIWLSDVQPKTEIPMPEKLILINKHRKINFDFYCRSSNQFIVSDYFKKIIDELPHPKYVSSRLEIRTREGEYNANPHKEYWYIRFIEPSPCIVFSKSDVKLVRPNSEEEQPRIDSYKTKVVFDSKYFYPQTLFFIDNAYVNNYLFCNQEMADALTKSNIKTITIHPLEKLFDDINTNLFFHWKTKLEIE
jgi:hypothetical protein